MRGLQDRNNKKESWISDFFDKKLNVESVTLICIGHQIEYSNYLDQKFDQFA